MHWGSLTPHCSFMKFELHNLEDCGFHYEPVSYHQFAWFVEDCTKDKKSSTGILKAINGQAEAQKQMGKNEDEKSK